MKIHLFYIYNLLRGTEKLKWVNEKRLKKSVNGQNVIKIGNNPAGELSPLIINN